MSMSTNSAEFEDQVHKAMDVPEPNPELVNSLREQFIARGVAVLKPHQLNNSLRHPLQPSQPGKANRGLSIFARRPAWQWAVAGLSLLVVVALAMPGTVSAFRRLLGYIPGGVGVVEQSPSALILAEPVLIERDGFTLTIDQAVSAADKTVVVYHYTEPAGLDTSAQPDPAALSKPVNFPVLQFPDGTSMKVIQSHQQPSDGADTTIVLYFAPLPAGTDGVTLEFSRLSGMPPGMGPEDWEIPLRFKPGDLSQIALPVVEYETQPTASIETSQPDQTAQLPETPVQPAGSVVNDGLALSVDKAVELPDGYLLMGSLQWTESSTSQFDMMLAEPPVITDANGQEVAADWAPPEAIVQPDELRRDWAYKITTKDFAAPLSLEFNVLRWESAEATFNFDPGTNPVDGQTWDLNIDVPFNDHVVKVISAKYINPRPEIRAFEFTLSSDPTVASAILVDPNQPSMGGGGGGNWLPTDGVFYGSINLDRGMTIGPMTVAIKDLQVLVPGNWTVSWAP